MADKVYDAIIIGGGHHGTIIAPYLAKAGMKVGVFERLDHLGGGAVTEDLPVSRISREFLRPFYTLTTVTRPTRNSIFEPKDWNIRFRIPMKPSSLMTKPAMWPMPLLPWSIPRRVKQGSMRRNVKKTYDQIARFSKKDAETYLDLTEKYKDKWRAAFHKYRYSPPTP